ncbi:MAG TPA: 4Fe-4S double cluster binding domain-containing protein [Ruminiclostridium sp.]|nr:4Fe-4S double cluster binding domain-containing protein [Ruminiclostridium sp.]
MSNNSYKELEQIVYNMGGTFFGTSGVIEHVPETLKMYPTAITFGVRLSDAIIDQIDDKPTFTYFNHYRSINTLIDQISLRLVLAIQAVGKRAYSVAASQSIPTSPIPYSGVFPHKTGAVLAGMGWIGKNGLFIHKAYGPRVRLGTVLTDMELPCENKLLQGKCASCNRCVKACPAFALTGNQWKAGLTREHVVDAKACSEYMNKNFKHIGRGSVCGICIRVCPFSSGRVSV